MSTPSWATGNTPSWAAGNSSTTSSTPSWGASTQSQGNIPQSSDGWGTPQEGNKKKRKRKKKYPKVIIPVLVVGGLVASYFTLIVPPVSSIPTANQGATSFDEYFTALKSFDTDTIKSQFPGSYVVKEVAYLNGSDVRTAAVKSLASSIGYSLPDTQKLDWFGKPARNPFTWNPLMQKSTLNDDESIQVTYPDYAQLKPSSDEVKKALSEVKLTSISDVEYRKKLTDAFAQYIKGIEKLPTKTEEHKPAFTCEGTGLESNCQLTEEEDEFWDSTLYGSDAFQTLQDTFAELASDALDKEHKTATQVQRCTDGSEATAEQSADGASPDTTASAYTCPSGTSLVGLPSKDAKGTDKGTDKSDDKTVKGAQDADKAQPSGDADKAQSSGTEDADKAPSSSSGESTKAKQDITSPKANRKYSDIYYLEDAWIGAYRLTHDDSKSDPNLPDTSKLPRVGKGAFDAPAGINTPVVTHVLDAEGNEVPIEVTLTNFVTGNDAYKVMTSKSQQNRGFVDKSDVQYAYYTFSVKNLGTAPVTITANDSLVDAQRNRFNRTGTVYGLNVKLSDLKPGESGTIESWSSSIRLKELYLIWGIDFPSDKQPVWFKVLAGDSSSASKADTRSSGE